MRTLAHWRPYRELASWPSDIDQIVSRFFGDEDLGPGNGSAGNGFVPAIESFVRDGEIVLRADLPGIDPKQVELSVERNRLSIKGERKSENESNEAGRVYREVRYGSFERTLALPEGVDPDTVKAKYQDGVLEITMQAPKHLSAKKVSVAVQ